MTIEPTIETETTLTTPSLVATAAKTTPPEATGALMLATAAVTASASLLVMV